MRDPLFLQELPNKRIVDLPKTDVETTHGNNGPGERPPYSMKAVVYQYCAPTRTDRETYRGRVHRYLQCPLLRPDSIILATAAR